MSRTYPLMSITADFTQGPPNVPGNSGVQLLPAVAGNNPVCRGWSTTRGRQYELDVVQAGTASLDVVDPAEWLNPVNTASPWNSAANSLLPYRCTQIAAWWNGATQNVAGNMLNSTNLITGSTTAVYDPSFEAGGLGGWFGIAGAPVLVSSTAQHFDGARSVSITYSAGSDVAAVALPATVPGQQWTFSLYVFVAASHTVTASLYNFPTGAPLASATSSTTGAWQRLSLTATPTTRYAIVQLSVASGTFATTVFIDAMQLEFAPSASAFTTSGPEFFPIFTGYVERYPQLWDSQGFRGLRPLEAVDALSPLSRTIVSQSYAATVLADGPSVFVPYNDDSFPQTVIRPTGGAPYTGYQAIGSQSASVSFGGDSFLDGSKAVNLSQQNADPLTSSDNTQVTRLGTRYGSLVMDPQAFTYEVWVRWTAGQTWFGAGMLGSGESTTDPALHDGPPRGFGLRTSSNAMKFTYGDANNVGQVNVAVGSGSLVFADQYWHHLVFSGTGSNNWRGARDNVLQTGAYSNPTPPPSKIDNLYHYVNTFYGDAISAASFANAALYNFALSAAQIAAHYQRGIGYLGEKSGVRALRLLTQYWSTAVVTDTGVTSMAADFTYSGRAMLDVLQEIADTESGLVWVDAAGKVHQDSRETRYTTATTSQFTFGENSGAGELPYEELEYDYDPTYVYSEADLTAGGTGTQLPPVVNATSQTAYGQRILSKTLQMQNDWDVGQAGLFYVQRYAKPAGAVGTGVPPRVSKMTLNPAANPALFAAVLSMDIGTRITVKRRTSAVTISGDYYVEQINHDAAGDASSWKTDLQLSPVFVSQPWILGDAVKGVLGTTTVCVY